MGDFSKLRFLFAKPFCIGLPVFSIQERECLEICLLRHTAQDLFEESLQEPSRLFMLLPRFVTGQAVEQIHGHSTAHCASWKMMPKVYRCPE